MERLCNCAGALVLALLVGILAGCGRSCSCLATQEFYVPHPERGLITFVRKCSESELRVLVDGLISGAEYRLDVVLAGSTVITNHSFSVSLHRPEARLLVPHSAAGVLQASLMLYDMYPGLDKDKAFLSGFNDQRACVLPEQDPDVSKGPPLVTAASTSAGKPEQTGTVAAGVSVAEFREHSWVMMVSSVHKFPVTCCLFGQQLLNYLETAWLASRVLDRGLVEPAFIHQARDDAVYEERKRAGNLNDISFHAILGTVAVAGARLFDTGAWQDQIDNGKRLLISVVCRES